MGAIKIPVPLSQDYFTQLTPREIVLASWKWTLVNFDPSVTLTL